jgi:hypothetical protein
MRPYRNRISAVCCFAATALCRIVVAQDEPFLDVPPTADLPPSPTFHLYEPPPVLAGSSSTPIATLETTFQGQPDPLTGVIPPDTFGAVGPNHVVSVSNTHVRIQNRTGTTLSNTTLATWYGVTSPFDPKIIYDPYSARWYAVVLTNARNANSSLAIGVSATNDPTGVWYRANFDTDSTNAVWCDYPTIGFNKDMIAIQFNQFSIGGVPPDQFTRSEILTFPKANALAGTWTGITRYTLPQSLGSTQVPAQTYDTASPFIYFVQTQDPTNGRLVMYQLTTSGVGVGTLNQLAGLPQADPFSFRPANANINFAPQSGTSVKVMNNDGRIQNVVYRNGSLWATHTVFYPTGGTPTRSAVQWWQINPNGTPIQVGKKDDQAGLVYYAFPSIAVNKYNDVALGYTRFTASQWPSANYSVRASSDPAASLQTDTLYKDGEGIYYKATGAGQNRWGDYSMSQVDPLDDTDFWTIQTYASTPLAPGTTNGNGRYSSQWAKLDVSTLPLVENSRKNPSGHFLADVTGRTGYFYKVEASTSLLADSWTFLGSQSSPFTLTDTAATGFPRRFYRASEDTSIAPLDPGGNEVALPGTSVGIATTVAPEEITPLDGGSIIEAASWMEIPEKAEYIPGLKVQGTPVIPNP